MIKNILNLVHQNIRSLRANFDVFSVYLASLNAQPDLIFISEIWIYTNESSQFVLPSYNFKACCNDEYRSGGVGVFIHETFRNSSLQYFNWPSADVLILDLKLGRDVWKLICIYRFHNKPVNAFCNDLEILLDTFNNSNIIILGDLNIDLLNRDECFQYQAMLASYGFNSLVNEPTRNLTCLDHVFVKLANKFDCIIENLPIYFSDHNLIKLNISASKSYHISPNVSESYFSIIDYKKLNDHLLVENWDSVYSEINCSNAFASFINTLKSHIESSKSKYTSRCNKKLKPWMNNGLLVRMGKLKKFSKKLNRNPNNARLGRFVKKLSKSVKSFAKTVKTSYYKKKFGSIGKNSKLAWQVIDDVLGRNKKKLGVTQIQHSQSSCLISDAELISNEFNKFFITVSSKIVSELGNDDSEFNLPESNRYTLGSSYNYCASCFFEPINSLEIFKEIQKLKNKHSSGIDGIDNVVVKNCAWFLVDVLSYLFNLSLNGGVFPDVLKLAVVVPVLKKGDECQLNNYRPISLLSTFSKLFEKLVKRRLVSYLRKVKFLHDDQYGFTTGKSTEEALLHFLSNVYLATNNSQIPIALFLDIAKAFDTVNHNILLTKLLNIGIRGPIFEWFKSYLLNRRQVVKINDSFSVEAVLTCGVPQGSVLGPLLFLIYFNSIFDINLLGHATAFADDLALSYATIGEFSNIQLILESDLCKLSKWFHYHKLCLSDKSRIMIFGRSNIIMNPITVKYHVHHCNRSPCSSHCFDLKLENEFKYLGLTIDSQLTWNAHLINTKKVVISAIRQFYNIRQLCPPSILRNLYHAIVESILMYGISSWGGVYFSHIKDLYIAQKRIVKVIYRRPRLTPTVPLFRELKLLPLRYLYVYKVLKMFFLRSNSFHNRITRTYNTRNPNVFAGFPCHSEKCRRFYLYMAPYWFHMLPKSLKALNSECKHIFYRETRIWLLNFDNLEEHF